MRKCNRPCPTCPWVIESRRMRSFGSTYAYDITQPLNCQSKNIIYCILCLKCGHQYVGETDRTLQERFSEHKGYVSNSNIAQATGNHFNLPGHSIDDMSVLALTKLHQQGTVYRKETEKNFIRAFNCFHRGMNKSC